MAKKKGLTLKLLRATCLLLPLIISVFLNKSYAQRQIDVDVPRIIIVLDDVGYRQADIAAFSLPVEVAFSILPQTPYASEYATLANQQGRDVMLHLPMESQLNKTLGPAALTVGMYEQEIEQTLIHALNSVPFVIGVNNHMGSALTEQALPMRGLMQALKSRSLFFLDSRTTSRSIAYETARELGVATDKRNIFLDHFQSELFYEQQFERLLRIAKKYGRAIGIAHPYPTSLEFLSVKLENVHHYGVQLQPISHYFSSQKPTEPKIGTAHSMVAAPSDE